MPTSSNPPILMNQGPLLELPTPIGAAVDADGRVALDFPSDTPENEIARFLQSQQPKISGLMEIERRGKVISLKSVDPEGDASLKTWAKDHNIPIEGAEPTPTVTIAAPSPTQLKPIGLSVMETGNWTLNFPKGTSANAIAGFLKAHGIQGEMDIHERRTSAALDVVTVIPTSKKGLQSIKEWGLDNVPKPKWSGVQETLSLTYAAKQQWRTIEHSGEVNLGLEAEVPSKIAAQKIKDALISKNPVGIKEKDIWIEESGTSFTVSVVGEAAMSHAEKILATGRKVENYNPAEHIPKGIVASGKDHDTPRLTSLEAAKSVQAHKFGHLQAQVTDVIFARMSTTQIIAISASARAADTQSPPSPPNSPAGKSQAAKIALN